MPASVLEDRYGLAVSTASAPARDAYAAGADALLAATPGPEGHFARSLEADPGFALARIGLARARFVRQEVAPAREAAAEARRLAGRASPREQSHVNALALGIEGKPVEALAATREHLAAHPRDAMVLAPATGVFGLVGFSGRPGREPELHAFLKSLAPHYGADWWFESMLAFAACEDGRLQEARPLIERSMAANPASAHGAHIRAHVLYEAGEKREGLDYLERWMRSYSREGLMHCHLSWHVALFALALGGLERAWEAYRAAVHPGGSWGPPLNVVTDSASFLWRAELAGETRRGGLWRQLRDYARRYFPKSGIAFVDVHAALWLAANGDASGLERLCAELRERAAAGRQPAGGVVLTLAEGFGAFGEGRWERAAELLSGALEETVRVGGSRAQRDLVSKTLVAAYIKSGRAAEAQALLARRAA